MKTWVPHTLLVLAVAGGVGGCRKDRGLPPNGNGGMPGPSHLELSVDSACVQAPNVFTPNGDGINDVFVVYARNIDSIQVRILNSFGQEVAGSSEPYLFWDGSDTTGIGPYTVQVHAITTSGVTLSGASTLTRLDYGTGPCLSYSGTPVCGDQLDPRICGPTYPTNDVFCP